MELLRNKIKSLIQEYADYAIENSKTYSGAIRYIDKISDFSPHGQAIKKAIQAEIKKRALNSQTRL